MYASFIRLQQNGWNTPQTCVIVQTLGAMMLFLPTCVSNETRVLGGALS